MFFVMQKMIWEIRVIKLIWEPERQRSLGGMWLLSWRKPCNLLDICFWIMACSWQNGKENCKSRICQHMYAVTSSLRGLPHVLSGLLPLSLIENCALWFHQLPSLGFLCIACVQEQTLWRLFLHFGGGDVWTLVLLYPSRLLGAGCYFRLGGRLQGDYFLPAPLKSFSFGAATISMCIIVWA